MRGTLAICGAVAVLAAGGLHPARAEEQPWCMDLDPFTRSCSFATYEQCMEASKGVYMKVACSRNRQYTAPAPKAKPAPKPPAKP